MQIAIDDKPVDALSPKQQKSIRLGKERTFAAANIISDNAATAQLMRVSFIVHMSLGILVALVLTSPQVSFALDTHMMDKGAAVVNQVYRMRSLQTARYMHFDCAAVVNLRAA